MTPADAVALVQACSLVVIATSAVAAARAVVHACAAVERGAPPPPAKSVAEAVPKEEPDPADFKPVQLNPRRRRRRFAPLVR